MEEIYKKNKFKNFINKSKEALEKTKINLFSVITKTKEKIKNTIDIISKKIKKIQKETNEELKNILMQWEIEKETKPEIKEKIEEETIEKKIENKDTKNNEVKGDSYNSYNKNTKNDEMKNIKNIENNDETETNQSIDDTKENEYTNYDIKDINFFEENLDEYTKQIIIKQILEKESKKDYYARGSEWIIFKIEIEDEKWEKKEYLVAKKRFDHNTHKEINLHKEVQSLMPIWNDLVRIPELKAEIWWLNWENYIIMDFIKWKTIYQKTMEEILHKKWLWEFNFVNDNEATTYFCKFLWIEKNTDDNLNKVDQEYSRLSKDIKIFDSKTWKEYATAIKKFIDTMHKNWIYHRDIHPKNIIIWDDGKLYIIDFGKSIKVDPEKNISEKEIYTEQVWEMTWEYVNDESWVSMIKWLTKSEEDEDNEQRVKKHIEKEKILTKKINSWDSVIKHFTELPKWFKIKMERKQFLKEVEKESKISKRISLDTFLDSKGDEQIIYLFTQSLENIENILQEIETQTKVCENKINKWNSDYRADQPLFRKEHITPYEKKLKWMSTLKKKLEKIKQAIE